MSSPKKILQDIRSFSAEICAILHQEAFGKGGWSARSFQELLALETTFGKALNSPEQGVFGFYLGQQSCESCELLTILIKNSQKRQGFGKFLLESFLEEALKKGGKKIFLEVAKDNKIAVSLYIRMGFKQIGIRHKYYEQIDNFSGDALTFCFSL